MRHLLAIAACAGYACGVNVGSGPARRAFPNPPQLGALGSAPLYQPVDPAACASRMAGLRLEPVAVEATSPWGISLSNNTLHAMYLPNAVIQERLVEEIRSSSSTCVAEGAKQHDDGLRFVLERIEMNSFNDLSPAVSTARVIVRVERFSHDFRRFASRRFDGAFRAPIGSAKFDEMLTAATRQALRNALSDTQFLFRGPGV